MTNDDWGVFCEWLQNEFIGDFEENLGQDVPFLYEKSRHGQGPIYIQAGLELGLMVNEESLREAVDRAEEERPPLDLLGMDYYDALDLRPLDHIRVQWVTPTGGSTDFLDFEQSLAYLTENDVELKEYINSKG